MSEVVYIEDVSVYVDEEESDGDYDEDWEY